MFYLMPIAQVFVTSFTKWDGFNAPKFNGLTNYINLFTNSSFLIALKNLLWWCVIALTLHVGFGTLVAFVLYQRPHGWKFTRTVFMIPNVISAAAWAMIYKFIFNNDFGILNSVIRVLTRISTSSGSTNRRGRSGLLRSPGCSMQSSSRWSCWVI